MSWPKFWITPNWKTRLLKPLSTLVCRIAKQRWQRFLIEKPSLQTDGTLPVCVIGNVVVGGSGKTPFILSLAKAAQARGVKVGIVSRGYGGKSDSWPQRVDADSDPVLVGDEPVMLAKALGPAVPIAVSPKRQQAVELLSQTTDCHWLISDDGLQHYAMPRVCEIVLVDVARGFGNGNCLPAGPLREPLDKIAFVDALVINGVEPNVLNVGSVLHDSQVKNGVSAQAITRDQSAQQTFARLCRFADCPSPKLLGGMALQAVQLINLCEDIPAVSLDHLQGAQVDAIAGIGNPERFFDTLRALGAKVKPQAFADHYAFQAKDLTRFLQYNSADDPTVQQKPLQMHNALIMTQKDAVKCQAIASKLHARNWWYLQVESQIEPSVLEMIFDKMQ